MYVVNHQEHCGEYRYCPERHEAVVSLRGHAGLGQDGLHFSIKGIAVRVGYFIRIAVMAGRQIRERIPVLFRRYRLGRMAYCQLAIRRAICCARL